jgi:hypothetical protein
MVQLWFDASKLFLVVGVFQNSLELAFYGFSNMVLYV